MITVYHVNTTTCMYNVGDKTGQTIEHINNV